MLRTKGLFRLVNVLKSQEEYFGDKGLDAKLWRSTEVYIPGERDSPT